MESVFPELFFLSFFVATLLRLGAAIAFFSYGSSLWKRERSREKYLGALFFVAGGLFIIGLFVQVAALVGFALVFLYWWQSRHEESALRAHELVLISTVLLSLLLLGAGAFAIDMPY